jgi:hypothetical protein
MISSQVGNQVIDERSRRHHMVGRDYPNRNDMLRAHDHRLGRHHHKRIEIAGGERVAEIPEIVGEKSLYQRKIGKQRHFKQIGIAIHVDSFLPLFDRRADPCFRQHAAETMAAGANPLDQRALWNEFHFKLPSQHLPLRFGIEADVADNGLAHQLGVDQLANSLSRNGRIIRDHGQVALFLAYDLIDEAFGRAHGHEAADHQACAIGDHGN